MSVTCPAAKVATFKENIEKATVLDTLKGQALKFIEACPATVEEPAGKGKKRKASERQTFMGNCMRSKDKPATGPGAAANGKGQGRTMPDCSTDWAKTHPKKEGKK